MIAPTEPENIIENSDSDETKEDIYQEHKKWKYWNDRSGDFEGDGEGDGGTDSQIRDKGGGGRDRVDMNKLANC